MIVITGAAGFIGSCMTAFLNEQGYDNLILVDDFSRTDKQANWQGKRYIAQLHRNDFLAWLAQLSTPYGKNEKPQVIIHLGARTDTTETDKTVFDVLNLNYSKQLWDLCVQQQIPLLYASSAATYGLGENGYSDRHDIVPNLCPLNPYGRSKNDFDNWVLQQTEQPPKWYGLKFFNVYGPNEYHKGRMASVVWHAYHQIKSMGQVRLFRSHHPDYADGMQLRDFIYVKDVVKICAFLWQTQAPSGLYNVGTGHARPFLHLAEAVFAALRLPPDITFIDTPTNIRHTYQYYTQADMQKLITSANYLASFYSLEKGIDEYVANYLSANRYY